LHTLLASTIIIIFLPPSFSTLFFIGVIVVVQLIKNSHYIWIQNKKKCFTHTRDQNTSTNVEYTNEVCRLRPSMRDNYPQCRVACDYVTRIGNTRIARHCSFIKLKFIKYCCSSCKMLADQVTRNPRYHCTVLARANGNFPGRQTDGESVCCNRAVRNQNKEKEEEEHGYRLPPVGGRLDVRVNKYCLIHFQRYPAV
jgi:hypothetical protein